MIVVLNAMTGIMAGIYFIFSFVIIKALAELPGLEGAHAMNKINDVIVKTLFLPLFFVSSLIHGGIAIWLFLEGKAMESHLFWAGVIYVFGMFFVTLLGNVPLNNSLKKIEYEVNDQEHDNQGHLYKESAYKKQSIQENTRQTASLWSRYIRQWTRLNHIRTGSCLLSFVLMNLEYLSPSYFYNPLV